MGSSGCSQVAILSINEVQKMLAHDIIYIYIYLCHTHTQSRSNCHRLCQNGGTDSHVFTTFNCPFGNRTDHKLTEKLLCVYIYDSNDINRACDASDFGDELTDDIQAIIIHE